MTRLVDIDEAAFTNAFTTRSLAVRHELADHPLFTLEAIADLADRLPPTSVRRESGNLPVGDYGAGYVDVGTGPPSSTVVNIAENGVRVSLRDIQQAPEYAEIINECLDGVSVLVGDREGGMGRRAGYLFITAPASTTPMHFDVEHSFLLQVRGVKNVSVASFAAHPEVLARERDRYIDGQGNDFGLMQAEAELFRIDPGVGVYLPSYVPHWVETEAGVSISFSIPFYTPYCERAAGVYGVNKRLRQLHLTPRPIGASKSIDRTKAALFEAAVRLRNTQQKLRH